jgi:hypothetical protein
MATLGDVFEEFNALKAAGTLREYALGGATAVLFYAEPSRTYDVAVFVLLPAAADSPLASLRPTPELTCVGVRRGGPSGPPRRT